MACTIRPQGPGVPRPTGDCGVRRGGWTRSVTTSRSLGYSVPTILPYYTTPNIDATTPRVMVVSVEAEPRHDANEWTS